MGSDRGRGRAGRLYGTRITLMTHVTRTDRQQPSNQVENFKLTFAKGVKECVRGGVREGLAARTGDGRSGTGQVDGWLGGWLDGD